MRKVCYWLDSNQRGILPMRNGNIFACCTRAIPLLVDKKRYYDELSLDDIQRNRFALYEAINNGTAKGCENCSCLVEKEEKDIDIGKIQYLIYHPHTTCNLKCIYCFFQNNEQSAKLDLHMVDLLSAVQNFHKIGLLKENFSLELGGGEPLLMEKIPETIKFLEEFYPQSTLVLVSNYTLTNKINELTEALRSTKLRTVLKTSIDCGTRESYKKIRQRDLFDDLCTNLLHSAEDGVWDKIYLKYILLEDKSNTDSANVRGFIDLCKKVAKINKNETKIIIDADMLALTDDKKNYFKEGDYDNYTIFKNKHISSDMIRAARKIYKSLNGYEGIGFEWPGDRLNYHSDTSKQDIMKIMSDSLYEKILKMLKI